MNDRQQASAPHRCIGEGAKSMGNECHCMRIRLETVKDAHEEMLDLWLLLRWQCLFVPPSHAQKIIVIFQKIPSVSWNVSES